MKRPLCMACCVLFLLFIAREYFVSENTKVDINFDGNIVSVKGRIVKKEERELDNKKTYVIYLKPVEISGFCQYNHPVLEKKSQCKSTNNRGVICYMASNKNEYKIGTEITLIGNFKSFKKATNPGEFDFASYYYTLGYLGRVYETQILSYGSEYYPMREFLDSLKRKMVEEIDEVYSKKDGGIIKAILLGDKSGLDPDIKIQYQKSGIAHILAISGLHISILGMGVFYLLRKMSFSMKASIVLSFLFLLCYGIMVGNSVSIVRAIGMFGIQCLGRIWGRTYDLLTSLFIMAILILCAEPSYIYQSGYWLSFFAVAGIAFLYPIFNQIWGVDMLWDFVKQNKIRNLFLLRIIYSKLFKNVTQALLISMSVYVMTFPLTLWFYYEIPLYSVFLNICVVPLMTIVMVLGVINMFMSLFGLPVMPIVYVHHLIFEIFEILCEFNEQLPWNSLILGRPKLWQVVFFYGCIGVIIFIFQIEKGRDHKNYKKLLKYIIVCLFFGSTILCIRRMATLSIHMLDTGQGDMGVIFYNRHAIVMDAGSTDQSHVGKNILIPFLKYSGVKNVDAIFMTHPDEDHYNGILELMSLAKEEGIFIKYLILPRVGVPQIAEHPAMIELKEMAGKEGIEILYFGKGMVFVKENLRMSCVHPDLLDYGEGANSYSQVFLLKYHLFSMAFMGDVEKKAECNAVNTMVEMEQKSPLDVTVLKVAHHGSKFSSNEDVLDLLNPKIGIISAGKENPYGHPHKETLERFYRRKIPIYKTSESGAISILVEGEEIKICEFTKKVRRK